MPVVRYCTTHPPLLPLLSADEVLLGFQCEEGGGSGDCVEVMLR